jgi:hypothetical protein
MIIARGTDSGKKFKLVPQGVHLARCYRIIDLGTQSFLIQGEQKTNRKVLIQFEVHGEDEFGNPMVTDNGDPMVIGRNYTLSLGEMAALRKHLQIWRGREFTPKELEGFQLQNLLDQWARISVINTTGNDGRTYANIDSVMPVPANIKKAGLPVGHNKPVIFSLDSPDMEVFESFSDGLKARIEKSPQWRSLMSYAPVPVTDARPMPQQTSRPAAPAVEFEEDDVPF